MNFLEVSDGLWRGPQPTAEELAELQEDCGLTAVINLREESEASRQLCAQLDLDYHHIPVTDWCVPHPRQVESFIELLETHPDECFLVHCQGGIGRTGVMVSCYRISQGWMTYQEALERSDEEAPRARMLKAQRQFVREFAEQRRRFRR